MHSFFSRREKRTPDRRLARLQLLCPYYYQKKRLPTQPSTTPIPVPTKEQNKSDDNYQLVKKATTIGIQLTTCYTNQNGLMFKLFYKFCGEMRKITMNIETPLFCCQITLYSEQNSTILLCQHNACCSATVVQ